MVEYLPLYEVDKITSFSAIDVPNNIDAPINVVYGYDSQNRIEQKEITMSDGEEFITTFQYLNEKLIRIENYKFFNSSFTLISYTDLLYENGNLKFRNYREVNYTSDSSFIPADRDLEILSYDVNGNIFTVKQTNFNPSKIINIQCEYYSNVNKFGQENESFANLRFYEGGNDDDMFYGLIFSEDNVLKKITRDDGVTSEIEQYNFQCNNELYSKVFFDSSQLYYKFEY